MDVSFGVGCFSTQIENCNDAYRQLLREPRWCSASKLFVYNNVPSFDAAVRKLVYSFGALYAKVIIC